MFGKKIYLFKILGFSVSIDVSWFIIAIFITWSLAKEVFPVYFKDLPTQMYWWMGAIGAIGLFASIIFHELCHSIVARLFGLPMRGITLFIFGGVAEMSDEPPGPLAEFLMAIAGPISSVVLSAFLYVVYILGGIAQWPIFVRGVIVYLAGLNLVLAIFNMVPAFPLDGGRVLRSILWGIKKDLQWATKVSSMFGRWFGMFLMAVGFIEFLNKDFFGGVWMFLIGTFVKRASEMSYQQVLIRNSFQGEPVSHFMITNPVTVESFTPIDELVRAVFL